jgi:hypothetical protein
MNRLRHFAGIASGFRDIVRAPRVSNPADLIRDRLAHRHENFLDLMRRVVFADAAHPYRQMFELAGCHYEDLAAGVRRDGLEATLTLLHRCGVYLSHDEFKLKRPIVRSNRVIPATDASFRNPLSSGSFVTQSGGSRSAGTRVNPSTAARVYREAYDALTIDEFDLTQRRYVLLKPILPATDGLLNLARANRLGLAVDRWFSPVVASRGSLHYRMATASLVAMSRMHGVWMPFPTHLAANDFSPVARLLAERRRQGHKMLVRSYPSPAVRVAAAARDMGLSIEGTLFLVGGETLTDAKREVIEAAGAEVFPHYATTELGSIGHACRQLKTSDSVHLNEDSLAVIANRRQAPLSGDEVSSLLFTSLQHHAPFVFVNVEMDDAGTLARLPSCPCRYARIGFTTVIRDVSSFGKLTGHGVTLVGTDIVHILEHVLPARFGGAPGDYQLVEHDSAIQAKLTLRVSRRVPVSAIEDVKTRFVDELRTYHGGQIASRLWQHAEALEIVHEEPLVTGRGKVLSLHVLGSGVRTGAAHES